MSTATRADALRNRQRILDAARECLAEGGVSVGMAEIAQRAGVGNATLFRHFETKDALVQAILVDRLAGLSARLRDRVVGAVSPLECLDRILATLAAEYHANRFLLDLVGEERQSCPDAELLQVEILSFIDTAVAHGHATGTIRDDISSADVGEVFLALACDRTALPSAAIRRIVIDGLRPR